MKSYLRNVMIGVLLGLVFGLLLGSVRGAQAKDVGQWEASDPDTREWYKSLMQPDNPSASCCGEADAYFADVRVRDGKTYAVINDSRDDRPLDRPHIPNGTEFEVPNAKLKYDRGNPTGNPVLFVSRFGHVYCFVQSSGI